MNVSQFILRLFFFCSLTMNFFPVQCIPLASNKYYYMLARNELRDMETKSQNFHELSEREKIVHFYFENLKQRENTKLNGYVGLLSYCYPQCQGQMERV